MARAFERIQIKERHTTGGYLGGAIRDSWHPAAVRGNSINRESMAIPMLGKS
jgi:hypothetical protein